MMHKKKKIANNPFEMAYDRTRPPATQTMRRKKRLRNRGSPGKLRPRERKRKAAVASRTTKREKTAGTRMRLTN